MLSNLLSPAFAVFRGVVAARLMVSEWIKSLSGIGVPNHHEAADLAIGLDFRSHVSELTRIHPRVRGYFPDLANRDEAIARVMTGPALSEARKLSTFPAARLVSFERARIQDEWRISQDRIHFRLENSDVNTQKEASTLVAWLMIFVVAAMLGFVMTLFYRLAVGHLTGVMFSISTPPACAAGGVLVQNLRARSIALRIGVLGSLLGVVIAPMMLLPERHGGGVSVTLILCAFLAFGLAYVRHYSMPLIRIVGGLIIRPNLFRDLVNQELRPRVLYEFTPDQHTVMTAEVLRRREPSNTPRKRWLNEADGIVVDRLTQVINELLGSDGEKLLVTQESEGLRRLNDPGLIVATRSQRKVQRSLEQMDGGSLAIAGPRGSGKSTLLRKICGQSYQITRVVGQGKRVPPENLEVFAPAPAEYNPKEFVIELFLQVCDAYLAYRGYNPQARMRRSPAGRRRPLSRILRDAAVLLLRLTVSLSLLSFVIWSIKNTLTSPIEQVRESGTNAIEQVKLLGENLWKRENRGFSQVALGIVAFILFPKAATWRLLRRQKLPAAVHVARTYQRRLRQEKTTTTGIGGTFASLTLTGSSAVKDHPWTMPQLVGDLRNFLGGIAEEINEAGRQVVIGIDEVDRIGSVEQAARFLNEVKAVFGITNCLFIVSVADDVGSIFARRAVAGRSVFENAFDDLVAVEPLSMVEAKELLQVRVEGFTDPFVILAYALSGGLPRELIRVTRRMVELKEQARHPQVSELAELLVREELYEVIEGTRTQLGSLALEEVYGAAFILMQEVVIDLKKGSAIKPPAFALATLELPSANRNEEAHRIFSELSAFADFCLAIMQAFESFDLLKVKEVAEKGSSGSYEKLALARQELSVSSASTRRILGNFRVSHGFVV